jgi:vacuolar-type H+-ATPase subunit I/STV1
MATNIPSYTGDMPDLASQGQEEISQNMTNFANYINALPTPLNTLASEVEALEQQTENNAAIATTKSNESASNAASAAASANQASTYADAIDGQNLNLMTESEFQALAARRREQYAASGLISDIGTVVSA